MQKQQENNKEKFLTFLNICCRKERSVKMSEDIPEETFQNLVPKGQRDGTYEKKTQTT